MKKVSKASVRYRLATNQNKRCGNCAMYHRDGTCDLVTGQIDQRMTCIKWVKK